MWTLGIDPGLSGAVVLINRPRQLISDYDIPTVRVGNRRKIDYRRLFDIVNCSPDFALIEQVHSMPRQGVASTFSFGAAYGACCMALAASGAPWRQITPQAWKKQLSMPKGKDAARAVASQLMPWASDRWPRVKDHNIAEAALLAYLAADMKERK